MAHKTKLKLTEMKNGQNLSLISIIFATLFIGCSHGSQSVPAVPVNLQSGDVGSRSVVLWARCNDQQDGRIYFDLSTTPLFDDKTPGKVGPRISEDSDYTGSLLIEGLKPDQTYFYRGRCDRNPGYSSEVQVTRPVGTFSTAADKHHQESVKFVWVADIAGQGWGRSPGLSIEDLDHSTIEGGYVIFDVIRQFQPDFALLLGDVIYADVPIPESKAIPGDVGVGIWTNHPIKNFVAVSLDQYRANWKYNLGDQKLQGFLLSTPVYIQWDDHEVTDNWYPGEILPEGGPYNGMSVDILAERARKALFEYSPIQGKTIYRSFRHGKHLELFLLDARSFRGPNTDNYNPDGIVMLGRKQMQWIKRELKKSDATWKVISTDVPLSIVVGGPTDRDAWSQGADAVLGREVQLAELLKFIQDEKIRNVLFITADVHYDAAISYEPNRARGMDIEFEPFWEFVVGPANAGAFGSGDLDRSFGPQYEFIRAPSTEGIGQNSPPPYLQSFGMIEISREGALTARLNDITGKLLYEKVFIPE